MSRRFDRYPANPSPLALQDWSDRFLEKLEATEDGQDQLIADLQTVTDDLASVVSDLADAVAAIQEAQASADAANRRIAIAGSFTSDVDGTSVLEAVDAGDGTATITVNDHTRNYSADTDYPAVAITGGDFTGFAYSTTYYGYYDDPTLADSTPDFQFTTDAVTAQANKVAGRIPLGPITTPASGGTGTGGGGSPPPAGGGGNGGISIP